MSASPGSLNIGILLLGKSGKALSNVGGYVNVLNGALVVNSKDATAALSGAGGIVGASEIDVVGNLKNPGKGEFVGSVVHTAAMSDPLSSMTMPTAPAQRWPGVYTGPTKYYIPETLSPGTYVGGIHVRRGGAVTLEPGVYYLQGGGLSVASNGYLRGDGVTIINAPKSPAGNFRFSENANVTLTAPSSGPYEGIVLYQNPKALAPISVLGHSNVTVTGLVYAPNAALKMQAAGIFQIIGSAELGVSGELIVKNIVKTGNTRLTVDATPHNFNDLSITNTDDWTAAIPAGATIHENIAVFNTGPDTLSGVQITDLFPPGFIDTAFSIYQSPGVVSSYPGSVVRLDTGINDTVTLLPNSGITYFLVGEIDPSATGELVNTATVTPPNGVTDADLSNNVAVTSHPITSGP